MLPHVLLKVKCGGRDAIPVMIGRHREPMAVIISVEQFYEYCSLVCELLIGDEAEDHSGDGRSA